MTEFVKFRDEIKNNFDNMIKFDLFKVDINKDFFWSLYLDSFPPGTNKIFKERRYYDCNTCKSFILNAGNIIAITPEFEIISIWDNIENTDVSNEFKIVSKALEKYIKSCKILSVFKSEEAIIGNEKSLSQSLTFWNHFYINVPSKSRSINIGKIIGEYNSNVDVYRRTLTELSLDSAEIVLDLINQNSLYRGTEHIENIKEFIRLKKHHDSLDSDKKECFYWIKNNIFNIKFRNTVIGTLLTDISNGEELDKAVAKYESKVAPQNYKRSSSLITSKMIDNAHKKVIDMGIEKSLYRRHSMLDDISVKDIIFVNKPTRSILENNIFTDLKKSVNKKHNINFDKVESINLEQFYKLIENCEDIEVFVENKHINNLFTLTSPVYDNSPNIFKWNNSFAWVYNGNFTDSIKEKVKKAGGNINAYIRFSLEWFNTDDLDLHVIEPNNNHIFFNKRVSSTTGGFLDIDMNAFTYVKDPVENIVWENKNKLIPGKYKVFVNNYRKRENIDFGFNIEFEYNGESKILSYDKPLKEQENVNVAEFTIDNSGNIVDFKPSIKSENISKEIWNINTQNFHKVNIITHSPNYWGENKVGNKHLFFIINECKNPDNIRGFFNEYLKQDLNEHRKVFEYLADKTKIDYNDNQLSGLGFSLTQKNEIILKLSGNFNRIVKLKI